MLLHYSNTPIKEDTISGNTRDLWLSLPVLGERSVEVLPPENANYAKSGPFHLWNNGNVVFGFAKTEFQQEHVKETAHSYYRDLLDLTKGSFLYRVWNYLPNLNSGEGDKELYKQFCEGRSNAFHQAFGEQNPEYMPAGSCVGIEGDALVLYFLAGSKCPHHHENPNQIPAYRYPRQYGPKSPSFARATSIHLDQSHYSFISGTAAVLGHESRGFNNLLRQLEITCDNLDQISAQIGNSDQKNRRHGGKVYLRKAEDYAAAREYLKTRFPHLENSLIYVRSDICRKELLVEIELLYVD